MNTCEEKVLNAPLSLAFTTFYMYSYNVCKLFAATASMTKAAVSAESSTNIEISWMTAKYKPYWYHQTTHCWCLCDGHTYLNSQINISSSLNFSNISDLLPGSACQITLLAIYNPASIDQGINLHANTKITSKYFKSNLCTCISLL